MKNSILLFAIVSMILISCKKETIEPTPEPTPTPVAFGSNHLFFVDAAQEYSDLELYRASNMTLVSTVTLSNNDPSYTGSVYMYNDTNYVIKVKKVGLTNYFYQGTVVGGNTIILTDTQGSSVNAGGSPVKWKVLP
jgi:hypothetical protein